MKAITFGAIMQACRERVGFTQEYMAELMDRTQSCISKFEKGKKVPDMQTLMRWADVTNAKEVIVAYMYGMDGIAIAQNILNLSGVG